MKKAVITISCGEFYQEMAKISHPLLKAYAEKIGADFIVWDDVKDHTMPHYLKLEMGSLLDTYDRVLYIDTDILVREDAPNIFDKVPVVKLGIFEEGRFTDRESGMFKFLENEISPQAAKEWDKKYYNTGVMVFSKIHRNLFEQPKVEIDHFKEQTWLNWMISKRKPAIEVIKYHFNRMYCMDVITGEQRFDSYFMHYAGINQIIPPKAQLELMRDDLEIWDKAKPDYKFQKNIAIIAQGGMGDQICAEPVVRYIRDNMYKDDNIIVVSHWPEIFSHLGLTTYHVTQKIKDKGKFHQLQTLRNPEHISWEYMSHPLIHGVDFAALQSIRMTLPLEDRTINLSYKEGDLDKIRSLVPDFSKVVLVHPGRGWPSKSFPADVWQSYINLLKKDFNVVVIGKRVSKEQGIVEVDTSKCVDLIDKLKVPELFALISQAKVLISNDSAPIHIAGAFDNWIGLIATCKHPDHILPYRNGNNYYKAKNLERLPMYTDYNHQPTQVYGETIDYCTDERMRACLPTAAEVLKFVDECFTH